MHHTFIITANVRGSLAAGRHNLSGCTNKTCTQKHANAARRLSRSAQTHVCLLKGNFVCGCECLNVTQPFFLIVWNWDRFLPKARGRVVLHCCSYLSHLSAPMYMQADTQFLKVTVAKTLATLKGRLLWVLNQNRFTPPCHCWWFHIRTQSATLALPGVWCSKHKREKDPFYPIPDNLHYKNNTHRLITLFDFDLFLKQI